MLQEPQFMIIWENLSLKFDSSELENYFVLPTFPFSGNVYKFVEDDVAELYWQAASPFVDGPPTTFPPGEVTLTPPSGDPELVELLLPPGDNGSPVVVVAADGDKEHPYESP